LPPDLATQDAPLDRLCYAPCRLRYLTHVEADLGGHGGSAKTDMRRTVAVGTRRKKARIGTRAATGNAASNRERVDTRKKAAQQWPAEEPPGVNHSGYYDWKFLGHFLER